MDLELTDEQRWLSEAVDTLLKRTWPPAEALPEVSKEQRRRVWSELVEFGALTIGKDGLGAVELCLIARSLGSRLAATPFLASAALRLALAPVADELPPALAELLAGEDALALALLEPGAGWAQDEPAVVLDPAGTGAFELRGEKVAVEQLEEAVWLAVSATLESGPALALVRSGGAGVFAEPRPSLDRSLRFAAVTFEGAPVLGEHAISGPEGREAIARLATVGSLLAAADAIGAAGAVLELARRYACERRQFGRTIGSFQALRHLLADVYVRQVSGWSTVLYAAAAFDDGIGEAPQVARIAKAYVSRGAREVAHGAMQVFGGVAFTDEHAAHRFLRRIIVREQQFGDGAHHERGLGRALAQRMAGARAGAAAEARAT